MLKILIRSIKCNRDGIYIYIHLILTFLSGLNRHQVLQEDQIDRTCQVLLAGMLLKGYWGRFERRAERALLGTKSDGGKTEKLNWRKKSDKKKRCLGDFFAESGNLIPSSFFVFYTTRMWKPREGTLYTGHGRKQRPFLPSTVYFSHKELFHKRELVFKQVLALRVQVYQNWEWSELRG